jgi:hypothetical protein
MIFSKYKATIDMVQSTLKKNGHDYTIERVFRERYFIDKKPTIFDWRASLEYAWNASGRPFFNAHPGVIKCLRNSPLDVSINELPMETINSIGGVIEIRFPMKNENDSSNYRSILVGNCKESFQGMSPDFPVSDFSMTVLDGTDFMMSGSPSDVKISKILESEVEDITDKQDARNVLNDSLRISVGLFLLSADPRFIEPVLLNRDKKRSLTPEQKDRAIKRAKRNGIFGFDIGKSIEISPHFRRPHFAIRWTGKGRVNPRLTPITGSIVNRSLVETVPTGYEGRKA